MGPRFSRAELLAFTGATLPDLIGDGVRLLFCGINPGLRSVAVQGHFAPRGNRFYPALLRAGITDHLVDASAGLTATDRAYLLGRGVGITSLVALHWTPWPPPTAKPPPPRASACRHQPKHKAVSRSVKPSAGA